MDSRHYTNDRAAREAKIREIGLGTIIKTVEIDKGHRNGPEIHKVTSTGIILIYNKRSGKMITKLIARVPQIKRYYTNLDEIPKRTLDLAREHQKKGWNTL